MTRTSITLMLAAAVMLIVPALAADHPDFRLWSAKELQQRQAALTKKVGPDHSARETLADFGDHRFRFIHRNADGFPEEHDKIVDVVFVQSGEGVLQLGGVMQGKKQSSGEGEFVGSRLEGGERHPLNVGDVVHIPASVPHAFLVPAGKQITYVLLKFPAAH